VDRHAVIERDGPQDALLSVASIYHRYHRAPMSYPTVAPNIATRRSLISNAIY
jgi:predicted transcriptional regulator